MFSILFSDVIFLITRLKIAEHLIQFSNLVIYFLNILLHQNLSLVSVLGVDLFMIFSVSNLIHICKNTVDYEFELDNYEWAEIHVIQRWTYQLQRDLHSYQTRVIIEINIVDFWLFVLEFALSRRFLKVNQLQQPVAYFFLNMQISLVNNLTLQHC